MVRAEVHGPDVLDARLPLRRVLAYGAASIGTAAMAFINALYLLKYCTDVLLIAPGVMGTLFGLSRIWDAVSDPIVGRLSDRTRSAWGRRRVWILGSVPATALAYVMLWSPPPALEGTWLAAWIGVGLVAFSTAQTMFYVPYYALGVELSTDHHERTRIFGIGKLMSGPGLLLGLAVFTLLVRADSPRELALPLSLGLAGVGVLLTVAGIAPLRERPDHQGRGGEGITNAFADVFRNPHARILLAMYAIESFGAATSGLLALYVMQYVVQLPEGYTVAILLLHLVPSFLLAPLWIPLSRRFGKRRLWAVSTAVAMVSWFCHSFLAEGMLGFWAVLAFIGGTTSGLGQVLGLSVKADVIDYDELVTGERKEGAYLAVWTFVQKSMGGLLAIVLGFALQWVGYEPNVPQSAATQQVILALYGFLPAACFAVGLVLLLRFRLNEAEYAEIRRQLDARRAESQPPTVQSP
jgi:GPH family glycoside/pentoside/hexuronide:cation symporter